MIYHHVLHGLELECSSVYGFLAEMIPDSEPATFAKEMSQLPAGIINKLEFLEPGSH
jgi:hypothetical protein